MQRSDGEGSLRSFPLSVFSPRWNKCVDSLFLPHKTFKKFETWLVCISVYSHSLLRCLCCHFAASPGTSSSPVDQGNGVKPLAGLCITHPRRKQWRITAIERSKCRPCLKLVCAFIRLVWQLHTAFGILLFYLLNGTFISSCARRLRLRASKLSSRWHLLLWLCLKTQMESFEEPLSIWTELLQTLSQ